MFFPSVFAGPAFDFREYQRWIDCTMFDVITPDVKRGGTKRKRKIPKSLVPATKKALAGIAWILLFVKLGSVYHTDFMLSDVFTEYSFTRRYLMETVDLVMVANGNLGFGSCGCTASRRAQSTTVPSLSPVQDSSGSFFCA